MELEIFLQERKVIVLRAGGAFGVPWVMEMCDLINCSTW